MDGAGNRQDPAPEFSRPPTLKDLIAICCWLNATHARYVVIGGMAMNFHDMVRGTHDIDLLVDTGTQNMGNVLDALSHPDSAARELRPEEIREYSVLRINDEVTVNLLG